MTPLPSAEELAEGLFQQFKDGDITLDECFGEIGHQKWVEKVAAEFRTDRNAVLEAAADVAERGDEPEDIAAEIRKLKEGL